MKLAILLSGGKDSLYATYLASQRNEITCAITIKSENKNNGAIISIIDTGLGINPSDIDKLFKYFSQVGIGKKRKAGGVGLGLSIDNQIIDYHNGKIWAKSIENAETTFAIFLPYNIKQTRK
jgi:signal transduction histidine kinase